MADSCFSGLIYPLLNHTLYAMIKGIDISHNNTVNWAHLVSDIKFVYAKASQGVSFKDPLFNSYWQYLKTTSLFRGAYHFLTVDGSAKDQAENFLSRGVNWSAVNCLPPMLDVEDMVPATLNAKILANKPAFIQLVTDWLEIVTKETGRTPIIYSYKNFFAEYLNNHSWPNPLWLASYQSHAPGLPMGYNSWAIWQYSQYGKISGESVGGEFDMDWFNGTIDQLAKL